MLYLIGLGIGDELDISMKGAEACRKCDLVFSELYTANWQGSLERLEETIGKKISLLKRNDLEEKSEEFLKKAKERDVALLVPGDPLVATTHVHLITDAKKEKIPFRVIHSSSILTAVAETGLSVYNFGRTLTIARPKKGYAPTSFYDVALRNKKEGMHTLFLLDIDMGTGEALEILMGIENEKKGKLLALEDRVIAASGLGRKGCRIRYGSVKTLMRTPLKPPAVFIIPGRLHFMEKEFLDSL